MSEKPPYTPGMREVMKLSKAEAYRLGHDYIAPDHFLLAIIRKGDGLAVQTLCNLEVDLVVLKDEIESAIEVGKGPTVGLVAPNLEAKRVLETTRLITAEMKHGWIGTEHLLLGLIKEEGTLPSKILRDMNVDFERAQREVLNVIESNNAALKPKVHRGGEKPAPPPGVAGLPSPKKIEAPPLRRLWVYADLSVFTGTQDEQWGEASRRFFDLVRRGWYLVLVSPLTLAEMSEASEAVRELFAELPGEYVEEVSLDYPQVEQLVHAYTEAGAVSPSRPADATHVAAASVARADVFLSWDFRHFVNVNRMRKFNGVNVLFGFPRIDIRTPCEMIAGCEGKLADCLNRVGEIQFEMFEAYEETRKKEPLSFADFAKAKAEESGWVRQMREKSKRRPKF